MTRSFRSGTANKYMDGTVLGVEKKRNLGMPFCLAAMAFLMTFWFASRRLFHRFYEVPVLSRSESFCSLTG